MDFVKIILEYLRVLIWPIVIISVIFIFRRELLKLFKRLTMGKEYYLEIAGQKLKVKILEDAINTVSKDIREAKNVSNKLEPQLMNKTYNSLDKIKKIVKLSDSEIKFLWKFNASREIPLLGIKINYDPAINSLKEKGFIQLTEDKKTILLTKPGKDLLDWMKSIEKSI